MKKMLFLPLLFAFAISVQVAEAQAPDVILIGATISESGRFTPIVGPFGKFMKNWEAVINERGGVFVKEFGKKIPVKIIYYDDKSDPATSAKFYERLITVDKVHILLGPFSSFISYAATTSAEKYGIPMVLAEANDPKLFERKYKWSVTQLDVADKDSWNYLDMLKAEGKVKTIAMLAEDTLHTKGVLEGAFKKAKELGFDVVMKEIAPAGTKDFSPIITRMKALNPDVVFVEAFPAFEIPFAKQAKELGLKPREFYFGHTTKAFMDAVDPAWMENVVSSPFWVPGQGYDPEGDKVYEEVLRRTGIKWEDYWESAIHFFSLQTLVKAIEEAGTLDRGKVMDALWKIRFTGISGPIFHHPDGLGSVSTVAAQIQKGSLVPIWPKEVRERAKSKHIYPRP